MVDVEGHFLVARLRQSSSFRRWRRTRRRSRPQPRYGTSSTADDERRSRKAPFHQQVGTNESETPKVVEPSVLEHCAVEGKDEAKGKSVFSVSDGDAALTPDRVSVPPGRQTLGPEAQRRCP